MYQCTYDWHVEFEWDGGKAASNLKKHDVDFAAAVAVLFDEMAITIRDDTMDEESVSLLSEYTPSAGCLWWCIPGAGRS